MPIKRNETKPNHFKPSNKFFWEVEKSSPALTMHPQWPRYTRKTATNCHMESWKDYIILPWCSAARARAPLKPLGILSRDVTKIKTEKLSILLRFYFHEVLEHLKTFIYTNFQIERVLLFAIEDAWIFRLLAGRRRWKLSLMWVKTNILSFCYLNTPFSE